MVRSATRHVGDPDVALTIFDREMEARAVVRELEPVRRVLGVIEPSEEAWPSTDQRTDPQLARPRWCGALTGSNGNEADRGDDERRCDRSAHDERRFYASRDPDPHPK